MATDKLFYKLANDHPAAIVKLIGVADYNDYVARSITFKETESRRDLVFEKRSGDEVIFVEPHGYADPYLYHRLLRGVMMFCEQKKFTGELHAAVIFLKWSYHRAVLKLAHHFDGHAGLAFRPIVLVMNQIEVAELERLDDVHLIPLYPLCKVASHQIEALLPTWAERIKRAKKITKTERIDLLSLLGGFAAHRVKRLTLAKINKLFGGFKMEDTLVGKELIAIGLQKGLKSTHRVLLRLIARRFGKVPVTIRRQIEGITETERLEHIAEGLFEVKDLKQLRKLVAQNGKLA